MAANSLRMVFILGALTAISGMGIDMYLPALPALSSQLHANPSTAQLSVMAYYIALGCGQLLYGSWSDAMGRKLPFYSGLLLFTIGGIGCACASSIEALIAWRFVQGLGACAGSVLPRAIVRDLYTGVAAARPMSTLVLMMAISPLIAPLCGSLLLGWSGWRGIFWALAIVGALGLTAVATTIGETHPPQRRRGHSLRSAFASYAVLLRDGRYLGLVMIIAMGAAVFFTYIANSSFVLIGHYGLSTHVYGLMFSTVGLAFFAGSRFSSKLAGRYGLPRVVLVGALVYAGILFVLAVLFLLGVDRLIVLMTLLPLAQMALGVIWANIAVLALDRHGAIAGTASALMGSIQFLVGATAMAVVAHFAAHNTTALPMVVSIAIFGLLAGSFAVLSLRTHGRLAADVVAD